MGLGVRVALLVALAGLLAGQNGAYLDNLPLEHAAIRYGEGAPSDPVTKLVQRVRHGESMLQARGRTGLLADLLTELSISPDSQALAFAKGSFQAAKVAPRNPRAIYFTDDAQVGYVPGSSEIEIIGIDPLQGAIFYTLHADPAGQPVFTRQTVCLRCHQGPATLGVPGIFVASVFPSLSGIPAAAGAIVTDHRTRFEERWGGWYVEGTHGSERHRGNAVAPDPAHPDELETDGTQNLTDLRAKFPPAAYLTPHSDIVALMTLEHQTQMINLLTRAAWEWRISGGLASKRAAELAGEIASYMLFAEESFPKAPVKGVSAFAATFPRQGPRDSKGRSLREFDLTRRLFRYPLSYLIYSPSFDALPGPLRELVYRALFDRLAEMHQQVRQPILEILRETKESLPAYYRP